MNSKLTFITKELLEEAAKKLNPNEISFRYKGRKYEIDINGEFYPFKLLIQTAAEIADKEITIKDFSSSEANREGVEKLTGFKCVEKNFGKYPLKLIVEDLKLLFQSEDTVLKDFSFGDNSKNWSWVWLSDHENKIGKHKAHYEIGHNRKYVELHFEGENQSFKDSFHQQMGDLPEGLTWEKWHNSKSIKVIEPIDYTSENVVEEIRDKILFLEIAIGDKVREIMNNIQNVEFITDLLQHKPQIILQGPPGTGKTYKAKDIAEQLIFNTISPDKKEQAEKLKQSDQFELIQFHPSYTYEDFVRGITVNNDNGTVSYETENKILAEFAEKARKNLEDSKKTIEAISEEVKAKMDFDNFCKEIEKNIEEKGRYDITEKAHILEVDYEKEGFRYDGDNWNTKNPYIMKFDDIIKLYLNKIDTQKKVENYQFVSGTARRRPNYYFTILKKFEDSITDNNLPNIDESLRKRKDYILIIDEINRANLPSVLGELIYALEYRGEAVESMYAKDENRKIILPPNLYIIGTMNTADRSVGHIDYAIRRRFAFVDMLPNKTIITNPKAIALFEAVEKIFDNHLSSDFQKNDVQLGHSYFMGAEDKLPMRLQYEIKPILMEYLKDGIFVESAKAEIENLTI